MVQTIEYRFHGAHEDVSRISLSFEDKTFQLIIDESLVKPDWARLEYQKCANCPLSEKEYKWCPTGLGIAQFLSVFKEKFSFEKTVIEVETPSRTIVTKSTFQSGIASLMGLTCATSGCPKTRFLRPMARFHLPFASEQETVFRSLSANLLMQYVENAKNGLQKPLSFDKLNAHYSELSIVNGHLTERIRSGVEKDAALNAVIILDSFALITPENTDGSFIDLEDVFETEK